MQCPFSSYAKFLSMQMTFISVFMSKTVSLFIDIIWLSMCPCYKADIQNDMWMPLWLTVQTCKFSYKSRNSYFFLENCKFSVQHFSKEMLCLLILKSISKYISLDTAFLGWNLSPEQLYWIFWSLCLKTSYFFSDPSYFLLGPNLHVWNHYLPLHFVYIVAPPVRQHWLPPGGNW